MAWIAATEDDSLRGDRRRRRRRRRELEVIDDDSLRGERRARGRVLKVVKKNDATNEARVAANEKEIAAAKNSPGFRAPDGLRCGKAPFPFCRAVSSLPHLPALNSHRATSPLNNFSKVRVKSTSN